MISFLLILLGVAFVGGQIAVISLGSIRFSLLDISVFLIVLIAAFRQKKRFIPSLWAPILGLSGSMLLSVLLSSGRVPSVWSAIGVLYVIRFLLYVSLYWVAASPVFPRKALLRVLTISGILIALGGFIQFFLYPDLRNLYYLGWDPHLGRLFSTLLDPNFTGIILVFTIFILMGVLMKKIRGLPFIALACCVVALLLTYSRSSLLAFSIGILVWGIRTRRFVLIGITLTFLALSLLLIPHIGEGQNLLRTTSTVARWDTARVAVAMLQRNPLVGVGMNQLLYQTTVGIKNTPEIPLRVGGGIDSSVLLVLAADGLVGLTLLLWFFFGVLKLGREVRKSSDHEESALYLAGMSALLVHSLFLNSFFYPWVMVWLFVSLGERERTVTADR